MVEGGGLGGGGRWFRWWREVKSRGKDNGFEPIHWKYECQGLHLSES